MDRTATFDSALAAFEELVNAQSSFAEVTAQAVNDLRTQVEALDRRVKELEARVA